jgi:bifunctional non-homologous end joining protein LigD
LATLNREAPVVRTWFLVHYHRTGRPHYDLRIRAGENYRNWSILKAPLLDPRKSRLAVERERLPVQMVEGRTIVEEAFGNGPVDPWDEGEVDTKVVTPRLYELDFRGNKMQGRYELRQTRWYPGNRWLLKRLPTVDEEA